MIKPDNKVEYIKFNFDVSAYRLLGRELITDRITALFELVKNAYDANSENVAIEFVDINPISSRSKIIIKDDGLGMQLSDIKSKWMVIGTSDKRRVRTSPPPFNRKVSGKKGIGRFAVDQLGAKLLLKTKKLGSDKILCLETDWSHYSNLENNQLLLDFDIEKQFFTDVKNKYWFEKGDATKQGTTLEISLINDVWTEDSVIRAYRELSKIISPNAKKEQKYPFNILIKSPYKGLENTVVESKLADFATVKVELTFSKDRSVQEVLQFSKGELKTIEVSERPCGFVNLSLFYFNQEDKRRYKDHFKTDIDGIKIYRDGVITTPFAEYNSDQEKKKDILGIDKRRYSGFFDRLGSRDLLGYLEITDENNSQIIESTNRQDFVDNIAYNDLKLFLVEQIQKIESYLKSEREKMRSSTISSLSGTNVELKSFKKEIAEIKKIATPEVKERLKGIETNLGKIQGSVNKSIKDFAKLEEDSKQRENLFFSLVSLQTYAAMFSHMTRHSIGHILTSAEYFKNNYPNPDLEERFKNIAKRIYDEMLKLRSGVDFMLKYAKSDTDIEEINIYELVDNLFNNIYAERFDRENIKTSIELKNNLIINYNRKAIEDIFDNLISNSIKALKDTTQKQIRCSGIVNKDELILLFSDNGIGINEEDRQRIFDIFFTKSAEFGGAGIGLYVVRTRIESMLGEIEVVENELKPTGATFKITLPFRR